MDSSSVIFKHDLLSLLFICFIYNFFPLANYLCKN